VQGRGDREGRHDPLLYGRAGGVGGGHRRIPPPMVLSSPRP
jgi:hypothetical protein